MEALTQQSTDTTLKHQQTSGGAPLFTSEQVVNTFMVRVLLISSILQIFERDRKANDACRSLRAALGTCRLCDLIPGSPFITDARTPLTQTSESTTVEK